jgi:hypothetical protein
MLKTLTVDKLDIRKVDWNNREVRSRFLFLLFFSSLFRMTKSTLQSSILTQLIEGP